MFRASLVQGPSLLEVRSRSSSGQVWPFWLRFLPVTSRPLVVTVDDLPIAGGSLHREPAERERITRELLAALARHDIRAVGLVTWGNVVGRERRCASRDVARCRTRAGQPLVLPPGLYADRPARSSSPTRSERPAGSGASPRGARAAGALLSLSDASRGRDAGEAVGDAGLPGAQRAAQSSGDDRQCRRVVRAAVGRARVAGDEAAQVAIGEDFQASLRLAVRHHERTSDRLFEPRTFPRSCCFTPTRSARWNGIRCSRGSRRRGIDSRRWTRCWHTPRSRPITRSQGTKGYGLWDRIDTEREAERARRAVTDLLNLQAEAWSRGDLDTFCSVYADDAAFVSTTGLTRGRQEILDRYRRRYPDRSAMGTLSLESAGVQSGTGRRDLDARRFQARLDPRGLGRRSLDAVLSGSRGRHGLTMLAMRRDGERWIIVHDASM